MSYEFYILYVSRNMGVKQYIKDGALVAGLATGLLTGCQKNDLVFQDKTQEKVIDTRQTLQMRLEGLAKSMIYDQATGGKHLVYDTAVVRGEKNIDATTQDFAIKNGCSFVYPDKLSIYPVDDELYTKLTSLGYTLSKISRGEYAVALDSGSVVQKKEELQKLVGPKAHVLFVEDIPLQGDVSLGSSAIGLTEHKKKTIVDQLLTNGYLTAVECNRLNDPYAHPANNGLGQFQQRISDKGWEHYEVEKPNGGYFSQDLDSMYAIREYSNFGDQRVVIIDNGAAPVDMSFAKEYNFTTMNSSLAPQGHATSVSAAAGAIANNSNGGVGPSAAEIYNYGIPLGNAISTSSLHRALDSLYTEAEALPANSSRVYFVNMSFGTGTNNNITEAKIQELKNFKNSSGGDRFFFFAATGNVGSGSSDYPASDPNVTAVGAAMANDVNKGKRSGTNGGYLFLVDGASVRLPDENGNYIQRNGTSQATGLGTGLASAIYAAVGDKSRTQADLEAAMMGGARGEYIEIRRAVKEKCMGHLPSSLNVGGSSMNYTFTPQKLNKSAMDKSSSNRRSAYYPNGNPIPRGTQNGDGTIGFNMVISTENGFVNGLNHIRYEFPSGSCTSIMDWYVTVSGLTAPTPKPATPTIQSITGSCANDIISVTISGKETGATIEGWMNGVSMPVNPSQDGFTIPAGTAGIKNIKIVQKKGGQTSDTAYATRNIYAMPNVAAPTLTQPTCQVASGGATYNALATGEEWRLKRTDGTGATNWTANKNITGLAPGTYIPEVKNAGGCTTESSPITINTTLGIPVAPGATITQPTCEITFGNATIRQLTGGEQSRIDDGVWGSQTEFGNLTSGTHTIEIKSTSGCTTSQTFTINTVPNPPSAVNAQVTQQPTCEVIFGSATIRQLIGGEQSRIDGGVWGTQTTFGNLTSGAHTIEIKNTTGCAVTQTITIQAVPGGPSAVNAQVTQQPTCEVVFGSVTIRQLTGGEQSRIDGGVWGTQTTFGNLTSGTHTIEIKNTTGCAVTQTFTIQVAPTKPTTPQETETQPTCATGSGSLTITNLQGSEEWMVQKNDGTWSSAWTENVTIAGLTPGTYKTYKRVKGGSCTSDEGSATINAIPGAPASVNAQILTQPTCDNINATVKTREIVTGENMSMSTNGGQTWTAITQTQFTVVGGSTVMLKIEKDGCSVTQTLTISAAPTPPAAVNASVTKHPTCDDIYGIIQFRALVAGERVRIDGGNWQTSITQFTNVPAGAHEIEIEKGGCSTTQTVTVNAALGAPAMPTATYTTPTYAKPTGRVEITNLGAGEEISKDGGQTWTSNPVFDNLAPGTYIFIKKNADGCTSSAYQVVVSLDHLKPVVSQTSGTNTMTTPVVTGATYQWYLNGQPVAGATSASHTATTPGMYSVVITVGGQNYTSNGMTYTPSIVLPTNNYRIDAQDGSCNTSNGAYSPSGSIKIATLKGDITYNVTVTSTNGYSNTSTFTGTSHNLNNLKAGIYTITIEAGGNTHKSSVVIKEPELMNVNASMSTDPSTVGRSVVSLSMSGGGDQYRVLVNGKEQTTTSAKSVNIELKAGDNVVEVKPLDKYGNEKDCLNPYKQTFVVPGSGTSIGGGQRSPSAPVINNIGGNYTYPTATSSNKSQERIESTDRTTTKSAQSSQTVEKSSVKNRIRVLPVGADSTARAIEIPTLKNRKYTVTVEGADSASTYKKTIKFTGGKDSSRVVQLDSIPAGKYTITVKAEGSSVEKYDVEISSSSPVNTDMRDPKENLINGEKRDDQHPLEGKKD